jgi:hypothetical protein
MELSQKVEQERSVLKWGGLGGMVGSIVLVVVFVIVAVFVGSSPNEPTGFPGIRVARTFEDGLYLAVMILWIPLFLALYRALRQERLAPALFGSALGIVGLVVLAAGALPHITTLAVSNLVHAPGATINNEAALELWKAAYAVFNALLTVGLIRQGNWLDQRGTWCGRGDSGVRPTVEPRFSGAHGCHGWTDRLLCGLRMEDL